MFNVALPSQDKKSEFYKQKRLSLRTNILDEFLRVAKTQDNRQNNFVSQYRNDEIYWGKCDHHAFAPRNSLVKNFKPKWENFELLTGNTEGKITLKSVWAAHIMVFKYTRTFMSYFSSVQTNLLQLDQRAP